MGCKQRMKDIFLKCDFLRYDSEPEYRTFTGAFCSIVTILTFFALFTNVIFGTFQKQEIIWSLNTVEQQVDSFQVITRAKGENKFMFAISIAGLDLSSNQQYFDISLTIKTKNNSISASTDPIPLEKCSPSHWDVNEQMLQTYKRMNFSKMLCPQLGRNMPLQGKFTSEIFKYAEILIQKCTNTSTKICVNETFLQNKTFYANIYFLNSLINPQLPEYLTYYLQDRNYIEFTTSYTSLLNLFISKFQITTDQSILPYQSTRSQEGHIVNNLAQVIPKQIQSSKPFANIVMRRSSTTVVVNRSFKKVDQTLSYIGGLFGFVMVFLILMKQYTEYSFQIDASSHLYHQNKQDPIDSNKFNFLIFIGYLFYLLLRTFGYSPDWQLMKTFDDSREQIQKQFDVRFLFERINFLQKSLRFLFNEDEAHFMHLTRKPTLKEASELRQKYSYKEAIKERNLQMTQNNFNNETNDNYNGQIISNNKNRVGPINQIDNVINNNQVGLQMKSGFKMLRKKTLTGHQLSKKIIEDLDPYIIKIINQTNRQSDAKSSSNSMHHMQKSDREIPNNTQLITQAFQPQIEVAELQKPHTAQITYLRKIQNQKHTQENEVNFQFMN